MRSSRAICAVLFVATVVLYVPVINHDFVNYDDPEFVGSNGYVRKGLTWEGLRWASTAIVASNWHPVTMLSHMLDCSLYGLNPAGHHLTNVLFHALSAVLLFLLLRRTTDSVWPSALVASLFAWHPLHVESVAWVAERKDVLSTCFGLLALLAYVDYVRKPGWFAFLLALFWYALSLMSKAMLVTLPCLLLLLDYWPLNRFPATPRLEGSLPVLPDWRRLLAEKLPFAVLSFLSCVLTIWTQRQANSVMSIGAMPFQFRLLNAITAYADYVGNTFWPSDLAILYPLPPSWPWSRVLPAGLLLAAITTLVLFRLRQRPYLAMGWFWFVGTLVPVIGLVQVGAQARADRYTYLPLTGIFLMVAWSLNELSGRNARWIRPLAVGVAGLLIACAILTRLQLRHWRDSITLFERAIAVTADNYIAYGNLGAELGEHRQFERSISCLKEALRIAPGFVDSHINLGLALSETGRPDEAHTHFATALKLDPNNARANYLMGASLASQDRYAEAKPLLLRAISLVPGEPYYRRHAGLIMAKQNDLASAIEQFSEVARRNPKDDSALYNLGTVLMRQGRIGEAGIILDKALRLNPNSLETLRSLAWLLATADNPRYRNGPAAVQLAERAVSLSQEPDAYSLDTLAAAYAEAGRFPEAVATARQALELAGQRNQQKLAGELRNRLQGYESKQPHREARPAP